MSKSKSSRAKQPIPETRAMDIPFNQLVLSDKNIRTIYDKETIKTLAESISTHGLLQSLSVRPITTGDEAETASMYEVQAGGRRFRAFELLLKQKRITEDKPIPCVLKMEGYAEDDSYVENAHREAMHPIDEFRAFKRMLDAGKSETDISNTHKVSIAFVRQRLRLASASPLLLQAFRDENIDLDQLMAYCVTDDHARQESVFERLKDSYDDGAYTIRRALTEDTVSSTDPRVRFVTLAAYENAGGTVARDLFSTTDTGYLKDVELLNQLVDQKLDAAATAYKKKGWKWAEAAVSIPHSNKWALDRVLGEDQELTSKEQKRLEKLQNELDQLRELDELTEEQDARFDQLESDIKALENKPPVFSDEDMQRSGVFISLNNNGDLVVDAGFIKTEDAAEEAEESGEAAPAADAHSNGLAHEQSDEETEEPSRPLSASLIEDLTSYKTVALRNFLAQDFNVAFVAMVHALSLSRFYTFSHGKTCLQLKMDTLFPAKAPGLDEWGPTKAIADRDLAWKKLLPKNSADLWKALLEMEHTSLQGLFTHLVSLSVNATITPHVRSAESVSHANDLFRALDADMVKAGWVNTADNYLSRVSKDRILTAVEEAKGDDTKMLIAHMKKQPMAKEAERLLANSGWLPELLRVFDASASGEAEDDRDDDEDTTEALPAFLQNQAAETDVAA